MAKLRPDPTFYPSAKQAAEAPPEELAYLAMLSPDHSRPDAIGVVDVKPGSKSYGRLVGQFDMPNRGDELHHFGWNACSASLCPWAPHPHVERRYLLVPGIDSSRIHVLDTKPDPRNPELVKTIEPETLAKKTGYASPHTVHCGPDGIYMSALGAPDGGGPGGIFVLDHDTFEPKKQWETERGPQELAYDFAWHLGHDITITSEWGTPSMVREGLVPELLLGGKYGHALHVWDLRRGRHLQRIEIGEKHQMSLELRPARDPRKAYGFVGVVISLEDLSSSVWLWYKADGRNGGRVDASGNGSERSFGESGRQGRGEAVSEGYSSAATAASAATAVGTEWKVKKVIEIPAEAADPADLPPLLQAFKAVPPLITDINLSLDDRQLYVSCWGTGELRQYDVSDPFNPRLTETVQIGGIVRRATHPGNSRKRLNGGPQMVELSRDGRRVYLTNGLYTPWDEQFYPAGLESWMVKLDTRPEGGMALDPRFFLEMESGIRCHQTRLQGGDASSDTFCFSS
ncbi:MAG TPA: selenium-binding protein SBP56-related protein [Gemmatimonadales bacterium]|nr:selenium-binding protein SBP56-related protein [Gemmatimonadales bacterium]